MKSVLVIGGGYFGLAAARLLTSRGVEVTIIDDADPHAGTRASRGLFAPEWIGGEYGERLRPHWYGVDHDYEAEAFFEAIVTRRAPIEDVYGEEWEDFMVGIVDHEAVRAVSEIWYRRIHGKAEGLRAGASSFVPVYDGGKLGPAVDGVVVACGYRNEEACKAIGFPLPYDLPAQVKGRWWTIDHSGQFEGIKSYRAEGLALNIAKYGPFATSIGDSYEDDRDPSGERARVMASEIAASLNGTGFRQGGEGYRSVGPGGQVYCETLAPRIVCIGGGDRLALGFAGGVACEAVKRLVK